MRICAVAFLALATAACERVEPEAPPNEVETEESAAEPMELSSPTGTSDPASANYPATSGCTESEGTIFSCKIRDGRTIAVCVSRDEQGREFAQYRFGADDAQPELAWPTTFEQRGMEWASVPYSGGGEAQLSFARGDIRYVIYSRVIRTNFEPGEPNNPKFEDGAYAYRGEGRISELPCAGKADKPLSVAMAERFADRQDELFGD